MKLRLHWAEKYETVREYPTFELDSEKFPELELEMLQVHSAGSFNDQQQALADLEHKMQHTQTDRGVAIFELLGPHDNFKESVVYPVTDEQRSLLLTPQGD